MTKVPYSHQLVKNFHSLKFCEREFQRCLLSYLIILFLSLTTVPVPPPVPDAVGDAFEAPAAGAPTPAVVVVVETPDDEGNAELERDPEGD